ncbi:hypothetical protein [Pseudonocardia broussonetiae]|uniref:Uncharacterized protein n=1 Tax=Pseudonocardia broussonetiae TaxID=2736640 RepID=A0A6M6JNH2_9PSEU|nr:hypothetical protein [Pseudonocardia broussonetiae]QJY47989.1 hypothetical protein HOP40_21110 [Pseudonocardia broussonetiae]
MIRNGTGREMADLLLDGAVIGGSRRRRRLPRDRSVCFPVVGVLTLRMVRGGAGGVPLTT